MLLVEKHFQRPNKIWCHSTFGSQLHRLLKFHNLMKKVRIHLGFHSLKKTHKIRYVTRDKLLFEKTHQQRIRLESLNTTSTLVVYFLTCSLESDQKWCNLTFFTLSN